MQFSVIYLETWGSIQPYVSFLSLELRSYFCVCGGTHMALNSFTLHEPVSVVSCVKCV
jgi:hypothetical protein